LRVTVDGKEAYSGVTPKSLGYVTLALKPTQGKSVRIALTGAIDDKDGFGMVEVAGKKLPDTAEFGTPGALEVMEAEIYEPSAAAAQ
jgi:beta-galactosidase